MQRFYPIKIPVYFIDFVIFINIVWPVNDWMFYIAKYPEVTLTKPSFIWLSKKKKNFKKQMHFTSYLTPSQSFLNHKLAYNTDTEQM